MEDNTGHFVEDLEERESTAPVFSTLAVEEEKPRI